MLQVFKPHPKALVLILVITGVSGCSTTAPSLVGVWPTAHRSQPYEAMNSGAATTSPLGGVAISSAVSSVGSSSSLVSMSGSITHNTGRIELNDGTYVFVDADGVGANNQIVDGSGVTGSMYMNTTFSYVVPFSTNRSVGGGNYIFNSGYVGIVTDPQDIPSAGGAQYNGESYLNYTPNSGNAISYRNGASSMTVDFAAGTADITLGQYGQVVSGTASSPVSNPPFDEMKGAGVVLSGSTLSGGNWQTLKDGAAVSVVGTGQNATASGAFFGYDPIISAPDEVAGKVLIGGTTAVITGSFVAD